MKLELGKYYRSRGGAVYGPIGVGSNEIHPFVANGCSFTPDGLYCTGEGGQKDLIEQVSVYPLQPFEFGQAIEVSDVKDDPDEYIPATFIAGGRRGGIIGQAASGTVHRWKFARAAQPRLTRNQVIAELRSLKGSVLMNPTEGLLERAINFLEADNE